MLRKEIYASQFNLRQTYTWHLYLLQIWLLLRCKVKIIVQLQCRVSGNSLFIEQYLEEELATMKEREWKSTFEIGLSVSYIKIPIRALMNCVHVFLISNRYVWLYCIYSNCDIQFKVEYFV